LGVEGSGGRDIVGCAKRGIGFSEENAKIVYKFLTEQAR